MPDQISSRCCCRYVVLNRPYSLVQWLAKAQITEKYVLMGEPDHLWLKPMPNLMKGMHPAAFPFFYIEPARKDYRAITEHFTGALTRKQAESIPPIGERHGVLRHLAASRTATIVTWKRAERRLLELCCRPMCMAGWSPSTLCAHPCHSADLRFPNPIPHQPTTLP